MTDAIARIPEPDDDERSEAPARKKKKKKKQRKQASFNWPLVAGLAVGGVLVFGLLVWAVVKLMSGDPPAQPVTAWEKFNTEDNEITFDHPDGWKSRGYGIRNHREAEVKGPGGALITVKENIAGSVLGDFNKAADRGQPVGDDQAPVARVHEMRAPKDSSSYQEERAVTVMTKFGKARRSAYKDGSKRGYRATVLMHNTALDVYCECRASDWEALRPAFERVIESLGRGGS